MMRSSYPPEDVTILLKDITGLVEPLPASVREERIQSGTHYCEMLPLEHDPSPKYMQAYYHALERYASSTADAVGVLADRIYSLHGKDLVLVSLARAGIPIGILLKHYIRGKYHTDVPHYAVSIIRGRGIDDNAMRYMLSRHAAGTIRFIDGWVGKGAISRQLSEALAPYEGVSTDIGVLSDPAGITPLYGTTEDILIPSSCLNATVTGLMSRTFLRGDIIGKDDFHGAAYYEELAPKDLSCEFIRCIEEHFRYDLTYTDTAPDGRGMRVVADIAREYHVDDIDLIKPGIGEATRVLLRRVPWKIIINERYAASDELDHIRQLAAEKSVPCETSRVDLGGYKVCGIIKKLADT